MFTGFNIKKSRKQSRIEALELEVKKLQKLLGTMMHLHERLKNERIEGSEVTKLPTLPEEIQPDGGAVESPLTVMPTKPNNDPT